MELGARIVAVQSDDAETLRTGQCFKCLSRMKKELDLHETLRLHFPVGAIQLVELSPAHKSCAWIITLEARQEQCPGMIR